MNLILGLKILQIVLSLIIVPLVLVQSKGGGLSASFGNSISLYRSKRGVEKIIFASTIVFSILFVLNSVLLIVLK